MNQSNQQARNVNRAQAERLGVLGVASASYGLDTLWLAGFAGLGTVPAAVPVSYALAAGCATGFFLVAFIRAWNLRLSDPHLAAPQLVVGYLLQLLFLAVVPQLGVLFLANMFVVAAFGALVLTLRHFLLAWLLVSLATGLVLFMVGDRLGIPVASRAEQVVVWLAFASFLGRASLLSSRTTHLRERLRIRNEALRASVSQVQRLAQVDELTQAWNRRAILAHAEDARVDAEACGAPLCVAMLDLDHFKAINDRWGHLSGDRVLSGVAGRLMAHLRHTDRLGRYGGEEFVLLLPGTSLGEATAVVERLRRAVAAGDWEEGVPAVTLTLSAGLAELAAAESVESLLQRADNALYEAKRRGRDRLVVAGALAAVDPG
ncbi:diguanylate cyclase [Ectothiorhodospiraceae bacterium WFHF3C12]|nr:diguanylate cyclase [Ectothiorhodospiraceae bacterium WFHF3C12]